MTELINSGINGLTTVRTSQATYNASNGEIVITDGDKVSLPSPEQGATVLVKPLKSYVNLETASGAIANETSTAIYDGDSALYLVSDGTNWYSRSGLKNIAPAIPDSGISRYEFEQDVTDSWGSNDGTDNTSAGYTADAQVGSYAKSFDGADDYVGVGVLPISGSFSVSMWVKPSSLSAVSYAINNYGGIGSANHYVFGFGVAGGNNDEPVFQVDDGSTNPATIAPAVTTGSYVHVVGVFDDASDEIRIYTNGTRQDSTSLTTTPDFQERSTRIGESRTGGNYYEGIIDDTRFYDKALSDTEVSNLEGTGSING